MFYKHASANFKGTLLLHSQNLFQLHLQNVLIDELQVENAMSYDLIIPKILSWISFIHFVFWIMKCSLRDFEKRKLRLTILSILSNNRWKKSTLRHFPEVLDKIMDTLTKCQIQKTYEAWSSRKVNFSDVFTSFILLKKGWLKLFLRKLMSIRRSFIN